MDNHRDDAADLLVIFGITGDLARRMTFRALYRLERRGLLDCPIIGVASDDITTEQLVKHAREAIVDSGQDVDNAVFDRLARRMSYLSGDVSNAALYRSLATEIGDRQRPVYYLEVPPSLFGPIVEQLGAAMLLRDGRVAVEKPLGRDLPGQSLTRSSCESTRTRACGCSCPPWPDSPGAPSTWTPLSPASWASRPSRTRCCCMPRWSATTNTSPGRTASRRPSASCSRCSTTRPTSAPTRAGPGGPRRRKPCSAATRAGSSRAARGELSPTDR